MTGILRDLDLQLAILVGHAVAFALLIVLLRLVVVGWRRWRAWRSDTGACGRIERQGLLGLRERLGGGDIAARGRR